MQLWAFVILCHKAEFTHITCVGAFIFMPELDSTIDMKRGDPDRHSSVITTGVKIAPIQW